MFAYSLTGFVHGSQIYICTWKADIYGNGSVAESFTF